MHILPPWKQYFYDIEIIYIESFFMKIGDKMCKKFDFISLPVLIIYT